jgi:hypothetical protein
MVFRLCIYIYICVVIGVYGLYKSVVIGCICVAHRFLLVLYTMFQPYD